MLFLIIFPLLRGELRELVLQLRRLRYRDFELDFDRKIEMITEQAERAELPPPGIGAVAPRGHLPVDWFSRVADVSPRAAIMEAWVSLKELARKHEVADQSIWSALRSLAKKEIINNQEYALFRELQNVRNAAVHFRDFDLTSDQAKEYGLITWRFIEKLMRK